MRLILSLALLFSLASSALADTKLLDCNIGFGDIAQIQIFEGSELSYKLLTNTGRWLPNQALDRGMWQNHDIRFEYRGERYKFFSTNTGRSWQYEITNAFSRQPHTIGGADCD